MAVDFHADMAYGIELIEKMSMKDEENTPLIMYFICKKIRDSTKAFKNHFSSSLKTADLKKINEILNEEIEELNCRIESLSTVGRQYENWKSAIAKTLEQSKNVKIIYDIVMFLGNEPSKESICDVEMGT